jgi:hypothetical protein
MKQQGNCFTGIHLEQEKPPEGGFSITAVPQLLYPETMMRSGFFLKKKPPTMKRNRLRKLWNRSRQLEFIYRTVVVLVTFTDALD